MEIVVVGVIVALAAGLLVLQLRHKLHGEEGGCGDAGGTCSGCSCGCQHATTPEHHREEASGS